MSKMSHFIPTHTMITALRAACLFLTHVWKLHGLLRQVVSNRGPQFIAEFMQELYQLFGVKLAATTTYHPQGDGQMQQVNQELEQYLQLLVNERQDDWDELLPLAKSQYKQPCAFCHPADSLHAWHWPTPMDGLWTTPARILTWDCQWILRPDGLYTLRGQVHPCKGQRRHGSVLQPMPSSSSRILHRR